MPKVSIIIAAFNAENYIASAIRSVFEQIESDFEVIVVDDGSTDSTFDILKTFQYRDSRLKIISQKNSGRPAIARNVGIRASIGQFICFLDADDLYEPQKLSRQIDVFTKYPEINLLFHDFKLIDKQGIIEEKTYLENSSFNIRAAPYLQKIDEHVYKCLSSFYCFMSIQLTSLHVSSVMVRRKALFNEPIWFEEEFIIGEDIDLWFRLAKHNNTFFLDEALSSYRLHDESITKNEARLLEGAISAHTKNLSRGADIFTADEKRIYAKKIAKNHLNQAYLFYKKMEMPKARECLKMARRLSKDVSIFKFYIKTFTPIFIIKIKDNLFKKTN